MLETGGGLLAVLVLILANGFFVSAEFALVTVRRTRVQQLVSAGRPGAANVDDAVKHLDSYIAACQLGITIASLALGWIGEPTLAAALKGLFGDVAHPVSIVVAFIVITALHVIAGELAPKGIALQHPEGTALVVTGPLRFFRAVFRPIIWVLNESGWAVLRLLGVRRGVEAANQLGAEELRLVVQASAEAGELDEQDRFLLHRVLRFGRLTVETVMTPRTEVRALSVDTSVPDARTFLKQHRHSRYPVYRDDLDNVIGVLHVRDLVGSVDEPTIEPLLRAPLMVPSQMSVHDLLRQMRDSRTHFAIAVDEYGGSDGIVTLENVLEEIVGELQDEFEEPELPPTRGPGGVIRIDASESIDVLGEQLGIDVPPGPYNTVAGYLIDQTGSIPKVGDTIEIESYVVRIVEMDELRIVAIEAQPLSAVAAREQAN